MADADIPVVAHNAVYALSEMYGALLVSERREKETAIAQMQAIVNMTNARVQELEKDLAAAKAQLAEYEKAHEVQRGGDQ